MFKNAKVQPLTRQEMIDLIEGNGAKRPAVAIATWIHNNILSEEKGVIIDKLREDYPDDMQVFYLKKPSLFSETGDKYTWCDVPGADPRVGRTTRVGVDEETAIEWDIFNEISEDTPDINHADMFCHSPEPDGRYRMLWLSAGPWSRIWEYRGMTNSLMDLYTDPENVHKVNQKVVRFFKAAMKRGVNEAQIDAIGLADDFGLQEGAFMSEEMFEEFYFPYYKEICDCAHELGLHVFVHSCGDIKSLIPLIIKSGVDVLHPIQKFAMNEKEIMDSHKDDLSFWVGMDLQQVLPFGTTDEVIQETRFLVDTFFQKGKGKLLFTFSNRVEDNVPIENIVTYIEEAHRYGAEVGKKYESENSSI